MSRSLVVTFLLATLVVGFCALAKAQPAKPTKETLQAKYLTIVKQEGYVPKIDEDGDLTFKVEGRNYFILVDEDDPEFFQLVYPGFWKIESEPERTKAFRAAGETNRQTKVAKVVVLRNNVWASIELYVTDPNYVARFLRRGLSALRRSAETFAKEMDKL